MAPSLCWQQPYWAGGKRSCTQRANQRTRLSVNDLRRRLPQRSRPRAFFRCSMASHEVRQTSSRARIREKSPKNVERFKVPRRRQPTSRTLLLRLRPPPLLAPTKRPASLARERPIKSCEPQPAHIERLPFACGRLHKYERQANRRYLQWRRFVAWRAANADQFIARVKRIVVVPGPRRPFADGE